MRQLVAACGAAAMVMVLMPPADASPGFEAVRVVGPGQPWGGNQYVILRGRPGHLRGWPYLVFRFQSPGRPSRRVR